MNEWIEGHGHYVVTRVLKWSTLNILIVLNHLRLFHAFIRFRNLGIIFKNLISNWNRFVKLHLYYKYTHNIQMFVSNDSKAFLFEFLPASRDKGKETCNMTLPLCSSSLSKGTLWRVFMRCELSDGNRFPLQNALFFDKRIVVVYLSAGMVQVSRYAWKFHRSFLRDLVLKTVRTVDRSLSKTVTLRDGQCKLRWRIHMCRAAV